MKTTPVESMEELIFKNRNKEYGAYSLRRNYKNHILIAMFITLLFVVSALTFPVMLTPDKIVAVPGDTITITIETIDPREPEPLKPPPDPPSTSIEVPKDLTFKVPLVTEDPVEPTDFGKQDLLTSNTSAVEPTSNLSDFDETTESAPEPVMPAYEKPEPMTVVSEMPSFPSGLASMITFIKNHLRYPRDARESNITGTVYLSFVVETDGSISEMVVARPIGGGCEEEAIRVLSSMPKWIPGKQNGRAVRVRLTLPVKFVLND